MAQWTKVEGAAKDANGNYIALVNGNWIAASQAAKDANGNYIAVLKEDVIENPKPKDKSKVVETVESEPWYKQALLGAVGGFAALGQGARQLTPESWGMQPSAQELQDLEEFQKATRGTGAGLAGEFGSLIIPGTAVGGAVSKVPMVAKALSATGKGIAPAAARVGGVSAIGGGEGAAQGLFTPVMPDSKQTRAGNVVEQGAFGAVAAPVIGGLLKGVSIGAEVAKPYLPSAIKFGSSQGKYTGAEASQGKLLNEILGEDSARVRYALENAPQGMTAGQVAAKAEDTQLPALEKLLGEKYSANKAFQSKLAAERARTAELTPEDAAALEKQRSKDALPIMERALRKADIVTRAEQNLAAKAADREESAISLLQDIGRVASFGEQQIKRGTDLLGETVKRTVPKKAASQMMQKIEGKIAQIDDELSSGVSESRAAQLQKAKEGLNQYLGRMADMGKQPTPPGGFLKETAAGRLFERADEARSAANDMAVIWRGIKDDAINYRSQLAALNDRGLKGINVGRIVSNINSVIKTPAIASSEAAPALKVVMDRIAKSKGNPEALYTIKKELGDIVKNTIKSTDPNTSSKIAASVSSRIAPMIDNAIDEASGGTWKQYLKTYGEISKKIDQANIMNRLQNALTAPLEAGRERSSSFANALLNEENLISRETGSKFYKSLDEVLTKEQLEAIQKVKSQLDTESMTARAAKAGQKQLTERIQDIYGYEGMQLLDRSIAIVQNLIRRAKTGASARTLEQLSTKMDDPKAIAQLMKYADADERRKLNAYMNLLMTQTGMAVTANRMGAEQ